MNQNILQQLKNELVNGSVKKGHPFKYFTLATIRGQKPQLRTVVLRKTYPDLNLLFYTDKRSAKIQQIEENNQVSALFYHPKKLLQLQISAKARIIDNPEVIKQHWNNVSPRAKQDYTTVLAPGTAIDDDQNITYFEDQNFFCMVELMPYKIDYLQLQRPNHRRVLFSQKDGDWQSEFLTP